MYGNSCGIEAKTVRCQGMSRVHRSRNVSSGARVASIALSPHEDTLCVCLSNAQIFQVSTKFQKKKGPDENQGLTYLHTAFHIGAILGRRPARPEQKWRSVGRRHSQDSILGERKNKQATSLLRNGQARGCRPPTLSQGPQLGAPHAQAFGGSSLRHLSHRVDCRNGCMRAEAPDRNMRRR